MRTMVLIASLFVLGCSGGGTGDSADEIVVEEEAEAIAGALHDALDKAAEVETILEQEKQELDAALENLEEAAAD